MRIVPVLAISTLLAASATAKETPDFLESCRVPGLDETVLCGRYSVFEDRRAKVGRKIDLEIVVLPATGPEALDDPILELAGGPGDEVVSKASGIAQHYAGMRTQRAIVLIDVRGTGRSQPLTCPYQLQESVSGLGLIKAFLPTDGIADCARALAAQGIDPRHYTTPNIVDDLHEVLGAMGVEKVNLIGASYGTRAAQVFTRRHPEMVRTVALFAPVPIDARIPATFARDAQEALVDTFEACAKEPACAKAFPDLGASLTRLLARVEQQPIEVEVARPSGGTIQMTLDRAIVVQTLRYMLYLPFAARDLPMAIDRGGAGDLTVLARWSSVFGEMMGHLPDGLYLSVTCPEDVARIQETDVEGASAGTFLGDYRLVQQQRGCALWPHGTLPAGYHDPLVNDAPTLIVVGERDPVTPVRWARQVASGLSGSRLLVVPDGGHDFAGLEETECILDLVEELVRSGSVERLAIDACRSSIRRPPYTVARAAEAIALDAATLQRYVGRWSSSDPPVTIDIGMADGMLEVAVPGREAPLRLEATARDRFRLVGMGAGFDLVFRGTGPRPESLEVAMPGLEARLYPVEPSP